MVATQRFLEFLPRKLGRRSILTSIFFKGVGSTTTVSNIIWENIWDSSHHYLGFITPLFGIHHTIIHQHLGEYYLEHFFHSHRFESQSGMK